MSSEEQEGPTITTGRIRRSRKKVDYSLEQQFSDAEDIFADSDAEDNKLSQGASSSKRKNKARKSNGIITAGITESSNGTSFERTKPVYTERGYDSSLLPIRERFTFEPEYEDDGTPKIELIVGRRLIDDTNDRQNYDDEDDDEKESDDNDDGEDDTSDGAERTSRSKVKLMKKSSVITEDDEENNATQSEMDYEYLLKYKGRSYLHLEWKSAADLESMGKSAKVIYRRFLKKLETGAEEDLEDPTFDPAFTEPGRILAEEDHEIMVEMTNKELAKWQKEQAAELGEMEESDEENDEEEAPSAQAKPEDNGEDTKEEKESVGKWVKRIHIKGGFFCYHTAAFVSCITVLLRIPQ